MSLAALFARTKKEINLIPKDPFEESLWGKFLDWGLRVGKWIVIVTQMVVVSVFLFRFSLDRKLNNLRKAIKQEVVRIQAYETIENNFRLAQTRLVLARSLVEDEAKIKGTITKLATLVPEGIWLEKIEITKDRLGVIAYASSIRSFNAFLENLKQSQQFRKISLQEIESGAEKQARLKFSLSANFVKEKQQ